MLVSNTYKKPWFRHDLTANDKSKTAKKYKKVILPTSTSPKWGLCNYGKDG